MVKPPERTRTITIDTPKLKPIRCQAKAVATMDLLDATQKREICQDPIIAWTDGRVIFIDTRENDGADFHCFYVSGERLVRGGRRERPDVARQLTINYKIDGRMHSLNSYLVGGRSIYLSCGFCGSARKMVGMKIVVNDPEIFETGFSTKAV